MADFQPPGQTPDLAPGDRLTLATECTAVIVTYNSAHDIGRALASLPDDEAEVRIHTIIVDNASSDDTVSIARQAPGVRWVDSGANRGYAGGINVGRAEAQRDGYDSLFVLSPDLIVDPGAVAHLHAALARPGVGVAVPRILEADGTLALSIRREPSLTRALGDALFGSRFPSRPAWLSETVWDDAVYGTEGTID